MRRIWDFHGGIHPPEQKQQSVQTPIVQAGIPAQLIIPLSQHIGTAAEPIVAVGEKVLKGQMIARADGFISVAKHASTSGTISAIEQRPIAHPSGLPAPCIVLDSDGADTWAPHSGVADYTRLDAPELIKLIASAGIAGMGGAGFPSAVKLSVGNDTAIKTLVINGTECEPYITSDDIMMRERADQIIAGAEILRHLVQPEEVLLGVEDNKPQGLAALTRAAQGSAIDIVSFPTKYPSGGEKQLIEILTGQQVPSGKLPASIGIVCQNIASCVAIYRAVVHGEPLISRITTVTGAAVDRPGNYEVLLGTPMSYLLQQAGYRAGDNTRLIMGGPMMGFTVPELDAPVTKTTNCLLAPTEQELPTPPPAQACIRCGMCAEACPASLLPQQMYWFSRSREYDKLETHNLFDCIECGACSYVCPSSIPLVQYYRASKAEILQARRDQAKSEHSRTRFETRQERLERETRERDAQRKARKAAAEKRAADAGTDGAEDAVAAAIARAQAKRAAAAAAPPLSATEQLHNNQQAVQKRLQTARDKLAEAQREGSELVDALQKSVAKLEAKLCQIDSELRELN